MSTFYVNAKVIPSLCCSYWANSNINFFEQFNLQHELVKLNPGHFLFSSIQSEFLNQTLFIL